MTYFVCGIIIKIQYKKVFFINSLKIFENIEFNDTDGNKNMPKVEGRELPYYNELERKINYITHLFGALISVVFTVLLLIKVIPTKDTLKIVSSAIYGLSVINMFTMSTIYHFVRNEETRRKMQKCDHISISISIAGSSTPLLLCGIGTTAAIAMVCVSWGLTAVCFVCNAISPKKFMILTILCYIAMGWMLMIFIKDIFISLTPLGTYLLLAGGISYTAGIIPFAMVKHNYGHAVWHFFVLIGSFFVMACVYFFAV